MVLQGEKMAEKWRLDFGNPDIVLSANEVGVCAEEPVCEQEDYVLTIKHVRSGNGRGFMPSVRLVDAGSSRNMLPGGTNGGVTLGTDEQAFEKAVEEGRGLLNQAIEKLKAEMAECKKC